MLLGGRTVFLLYLSGIHIQRLLQWRSSNPKGCLHYQLKEYLSVYMKIGPRGIATNTSQQEATVNCALSGSRRSLSSDQTRPVLTSSYHSVKLNLLDMTFEIILKNFALLFACGGAGLFSHCVPAVTLSQKTTTHAESTAEHKGQSHTH